MRTLTKVILILLLCSACYGANDFSGDGNCVALWKFENGALTTDSKGSNTLSASGTPAADTVNYQEGAASCDFDPTGPDYFSITDAALDVGFPHKSGGGTTISLCFWFKLETLPAAASWEFFYSKLETNKGDFDVGIYSNTGTFTVRKWNPGGIASETISHATTVTTGIWYHAGITWNSVDKAYRIRIWDDNAGSILGVDKTGTTTNAGNAEDSYLQIGAITGILSLDGLLDELVVFNDVLSADEIDQIRAGTYGAAPPAGGGGQVIIIGMD